MVVEVNLLDGIKVWFNFGFLLKYFVKFIGDMCMVEFDGEVYFFVCKDRSKWFVVNIFFNIQIEVLGMEFNMEVYWMDSVVRIMLVLGLVRLLFLGKGDIKEIFVMKFDEEFVYNMVIYEVWVEKLYVEIYIVWKNGQVVFKNILLVEMLKIFSKRFNVEFIVKDFILYVNFFIGVFSRQYLLLIFEYFRYVFGIQYKYFDLEYDVIYKVIQEKIKIELY